MYEKKVFLSINKTEDPFAYQTHVWCAQYLLLAWDKSFQPPYSNSIFIFHKRILKLILEVIFPAESFVQMRKMRFRNTKWFASSNTLLQVRVKAGLESRSGAYALSTTLHSSPSKYVTANPSPEVEKELIDISACKRLVECLSCYRCIHTSIYEHGER